MKNDSHSEKASNAILVVWEDKYITGIKTIDDQHRQLFDLTNQLYNACLANENELDKEFKEAMHAMVKYVHFHFDAELKFLHAVNFPECHHHKTMHDGLIKDILAAVNDYNEGKKFVPNNFVRILREWILSHVAFYDKQYSAFVHEQIKIGLLSENNLNEIEKSIS